MAYQTLYRRYRPRGFAQGFVGQEHIVKTLQNSLAAGQLAHAYLFSGPRGTGKTTTAKILAKGVNCLSSEGPVPEPCNQCELCQGVDSGTAMDVIEMDAATNRGIEEVRDLRERIQYAPALGRYKVYIIDEVHMLTAEAFNALLKTLEEPPAHVIFILATTEPQKVPDTILSRCQRFDFRPLTEDLIAAHLGEIARQSGMALDPEAADILAFRAQGGMRDAIGLLEQVMAFTQGEIQAEQVWEALGTADKDKLVELANSLATRDISRVLPLLEEFGRMGLDYRQLLADLLELLRERLLHLTGARQRSLLAESSLVTVRAVMEMMDAVAEGLQDSKRWTHPRLAVELTAVRLCLETGSPPATAPAPARETAQAVPAPVRETAQAVPAPVQETAQVAPAPVRETAQVAPAKWEEILSLVREESISSYAWLKEAKAFMGEGGLVLEYPGNYRLHCENIMKPEHRQLLLPAFKKVLGTENYQVTMR